MALAEERAPRIKQFASPVPLITKELALVLAAVSFDLDPATIHVAADPLSLAEAACVEAQLALSMCRVPEPLAFIHITVGIHKLSPPLPLSARKFSLVHTGVSESELALPICEVPEGPNLSLEEGPQRPTILGAIEVEVTFCDLTPVVRGPQQPLEQQEQQERAAGCQGGGP